MPLFNSRAVRLAALGAASVVTLAGLSAAASADPNAEPPSTPVPIETPDGVISSYVVNAKHANPGQTRLVERAVEKAGGVVVQTWPQIGVVIAHSDNGSFRADVTKAGKSAVESVGATRTVAVSEGTPEGAQAPWGPGKGHLKIADAERSDNNVGAEQSEAVVLDPNEAAQWDMQMIKADQAHEITDGSPDVLVGVLDSGIDPDHPDLEPNIDVANSVNCSDAGRPDTSATGWHPTTSDHGTHVAGTIAAPRNGIGIVGVAPGVKMAAVKVVNDDGFIYPEYAVCGFMWAAMHGMDVTNNSYYVDPFEFWCADQPEQSPSLEAVRRAVEWSTDQGVAHVAASGNSSIDLANKTTNDSSPNDSNPVERTINSGCKDMPAELDGVVTVSSLERYPSNTLENRLSYFSNRGLGVIDVAAPGSRVLSTIVTGNGYATKSGTSMASPHVAGVLALMKSVHPDWTPEQMIAALEQQAVDHDCGPSTAGAACEGTAEDNSYYGEGVVDALAAVS